MAKDDIGRIDLIDFHEASASWLVASGGLHCGRGYWKLSTASRSRGIWMSAMRPDTPCSDLGMLTAHFSGFTLPLRSPFIGPCFHSRGAEQANWSRCQACFCLRASFWAVSFRTTAIRAGYSSHTHRRSVPHRRGNPNREKPERCGRLDPLISITWLANDESTGLDHFSGDVPQYAELLQPHHAPDP